ncbi:hypothetical protein B0H10DRAFT_1807598, partial [Mycena sp. CBHHK59/15]
EPIEPAVKGTDGMLESALKYGCVVLGVSPEMTDASPPFTANPSNISSGCHNCNDQAMQEVEEKGRAASGGAKYRTSKTLAERGTSAVHYITRCTH